MRTKDRAIYRQSRRKKNLRCVAFDSTRNRADERQRGLCVESMGRKCHCGPASRLFMACLRIEIQPDQSLRHRGRKGSPNFGPAVWSPINLFHLGTLRNSFQNFIQSDAPPRLYRSRLRLLDERKAAIFIRNPLDRIANRERSLGGDLFGDLNRERVSHANDLGCHRGNSC